MLSLCSKWWRHQILLILTIDWNFNTAIEISIISYPHMLTFNLLLWFVTKILAILCFPYLQTDDVIRFDQFCRVDTNFNTIIKISVINYLYLPNFNFILNFITKISTFHVSVVLRIMTSSNLIVLTVDSNFNTINEISIISCLCIRNFSFILHFVTKMLAIS